MAMFDRFRGSTTHAQAIETKDGEWKEHLTEGQKEVFGFTFGAKVFAGALAGVAVVGLMPLPMVPFLGCLAIYTAASAAQAVIRNQAGDTNKPIVKSFLNPFANTFKND